MTDESRSAPESRVYSDRDDDRLLRIDAALAMVPLARYDDTAKLAEVAIGEFIRERDNAAMELEWEVTVVQADLRERLDEALTALREILAFTHDREAQPSFYLRLIQETCNRALSTADSGGLQSLPESVAAVLPVQEKPDR